MKKYIIAKQGKSTSLNVSWAIRSKNHTYQHEQKFSSLDYKINIAAARSINNPCVASKLPI